MVSREFVGELGKTVSVKEDQGMSYVQSGVLLVESGDVSSEMVLNGQCAIDKLSGSPSAAIVDSGGPLVGADIINFGRVALNTGGLAIDVGDRASHPGICRSTGKTCLSQRRSRGDQDVLRRIRSIIR